MTELGVSCAKLV